jgi:hypothetical protein
VRSVRTMVPRHATDTSRSELPSLTLRIGLASDAMSFDATASTAKGAIAADDRSCRFVAWLVM